MITDLQPRKSSTTWVLSSSSNHVKSLQKRNARHVLNIGHRESCAASADKAYCRQKIEQIQTLLTPQTCMRTDLESDLRLGYVHLNRPSSTSHCSTQNSTSPQDSGSHSYSLNKKQRRMTKEKCHLLSIPYFIIRKGAFRGAKNGKFEEQYDQYKAVDYLRKADGNWVERTKMQILINSHWKTGPARLPEENEQGTRTTGS